MNIIQEEVEQAEVKTTNLSLMGLYNTLNDWLIDMSSVSVKDQMVFFQLFGAMVSAGLSVVKALELLQGQTKNEKLKRVMQDMQVTIEGGGSLATAMKHNSDIFDEATSAVVEAGERSGRLVEVLKELTGQYEKLNKMSGKVKSVMMYPMIVCVVMFLLIVIVLLFVVPKMMDLFGGAENLPLPTRILIAGSDLVRNQWYLLFGGIIAFVGLFKYWKGTRSGAKQWDLVLLNLPVMGGIKQYMILGRICRVLSFLIESGVPVMEALKITSHAAQNELYQEKLLLAADDLGRGINIAENLSDNERLFPAMVVSMISIGEKTASLDAVLGKAAGFYDEELDRKIGNLSKLMEPFILAIIAAGAVFLIMAIYLPILKMNDNMG